MNGTQSVTVKGKEYREWEVATTERQTNTCGNCGKNGEQLTPIFQYKDKHNLWIVGWVCCN